jgi:hypothetical protein
MSDLAGWLAGRSEKQLKNKLLRYSGLSWCKVSRPVLPTASAAQGSEARLNGPKPELVARLVSLACASDSTTFKEIFYDYFSLPSPYKSVPPATPTRSRHAASSVIISQKPAVSAAPEKGPECSVCLVARVATVLLPCGHACTCLACSSRLTRNPWNHCVRCPLCRAVVTTVSRLYFA